MPVFVVHEQDTTNPTANHCYIQSTERKATLNVLIERQVQTPTARPSRYTITVGPGEKKYVGLGCVFATYTSLCTTPISTTIISSAVVKNYTLEELHDFIPSEAVFENE